MNRNMPLRVVGGGLCLLLIGELLAHLDPGPGSAQIAQVPMAKAAQPSSARNSAHYGPNDADLSVTKVDAPDPVTVGRNLAYEIIVTNHGPHEDSGVVLVDTLPLSVSLAWAPSGCTGTSVVTCHIGTLRKGASASVTILVTPATAGTITNYASVSGNGVDPDPSDNTATQRTTVNPPPSVRFSNSAYSVVENAGPIVITATLSAACDIVTSVKYATSEGTAVAGTSGDYITVTGTLTFTPGMTRLTFSVPIVNDTIFEESETLILTLSDPSGLLLGTPNVATLTIVDDDTSPKVQFSSSTYRVYEDANSAVIIARLSAPVGQTATVNYATVDGTAKGGNDYIISSGTLTFSPNETAEGFAVPIINDSSDELDETVALTLSNYVNIMPGTPNSATLTIIDDDGEPTVKFGSSVYTVEEAKGPALVTATLSNASGFTVTAVVTTGDGTASGNTDYVTAIHELVFAPSQTSATFAIVITDDLDIEGDETVLLAMAAPTCATLGIPCSAELAIVDDDRPARSVFLPLIMRDYCEFVGPYECEPNSPYSNANGPLSSDTDYYGFHSGSGEDRDYYKLYLGDGGQITIDLTDITNDTFGQDVQLHVFYQSTDIRIGFDAVAPYHIICPSTGSPECTGGMPGWYYILVYTPSGYSSSKPYKLRITYP